MFTNNARCSRRRLLKAQAALWGALLLGLATPAVPAESFPVLIRVEAAKSQGDLKPIWLDDYAIGAVRRALPTARVGGPDVAGSGGKFMRDFLEHCLRGTNYATGQVGTPLDFVAFHAKGAPTTTNGHVRMGIRQHLATIEEGFRLIASYPELKGKPIIIGESDPEGCAACQGPSLAYRNGTMYSSYTAASFARKHDLAENHGVNLEGALTWAFEFEDQPYFAGFRSLASNDIEKRCSTSFANTSRRPRSA